MKIKCNNCGNDFVPGNRPDGTPNGVGFQMQDGSIINLCADCLIKLGSMKEDEKAKFIERIVKK